MCRQSETFQDNSDVDWFDNAIKQIIKWKRYWALHPGSQPDFGTPEYEDFRAYGYLKDPPAEAVQ
jgi:hypothetical protein